MNFTGLQNSFFSIGLSFDCNKHVPCIFCQVREQIELYNKQGRPVVGCCIEPIQAEGGDNFASPRFFQELQRICKEVI